MLATCEGLVVEWALPRVELQATGIQSRLPAWKYESITALGRLSVYTSSIERAT